MLYLTLNSQNEIVLDCSPNTAIDSLFYFEFIHDQQKKLFEITLEDQSQYPESYNVFELDLSVDLLDMVKRGDYEYKVYDAVDKDNMVAIGKMKLVGTDRPNKTNNITTGNNKIHNDRSI